MPEFKKGDRVRRIGSVYDVYKPYIQVGGEYVVTSYISPKSMNIEGCPMVVDPCEFELVIVEPTDEDLADEYRSNYLRGREIKHLLKERGYKYQWKAPTRGVNLWKDGVYADTPDEIRFQKTTTETVMVPTVKTTTKEI